MDNVTVIKRKDASRPVMRQTVINGAEYLAFPAIEETGVVRHLMSTRLGGVSEGDLWSMNVSFIRRILPISAMLQKRIKGRGSCVPEIIRMWTA